MKKTIGLIVAGSLIFVANAMATPEYLGNTTADFEWGATQNGIVPNINNGDFGYYLWSNELRTDWSLRWIGETQNDYDWFGSIVFRGLDNTSLAEISFEGPDTSSQIAGTFDEITYEAFTGPHWDGLDFSLDGPNGELEFYLGYIPNSLTSGNNQLGVDIYIGSSFNTPNVDVFGLGGSDANLSQNFEISAPIPEPASMLLFGAGLAGLAGITRRKRN